jgi:hypothetical protein
MPIISLPEEHQDAASKLAHRLYQESSVQEYIIMRKKREDMEFRRKKAQENGNVRTDEAGA